MNKWCGIQLHGISGVDAGWITARRREPTQTCDLLEQGLLVSISPVCADDNGTVLNVNADVVAARQAVSLREGNLILVWAGPIGCRIERRGLHSIRRP